MYLVYGSMKLLIFLKEEVVRIPQWVMGSSMHTRFEYSNCHMSMKHDTPNKPRPTNLESISNNGDHVTLH